MYNKNDKIRIKITDMGHDGEGIGKTDAFTWFVKDTVIGDEIEAVVMKVKKSYGYARLLKIITPSLDRVEPVCPVAKRCGGCSLQNMSYEAELRYKECKVKNNLMRIGGFSLDEKDKQSKKEGTSVCEFEGIVGMDDPWRYRNKAQFPIGKDKNGKLIAGFYAGHSHDIIESRDCLIGVTENKSVLDIVLKYMEENHIEPYDEMTRRGIIRHILIRKGFTTGELMTCIVINADKLKQQDILCDKLMHIPGMKTVVLNINKENTNVILGQEVKVLTGPGYIEDYIGEIKFRISAKSFFQVNPVQTKVLYEKALEYANLSGDEIVWDLYCGIGTISLFLAQKAKRVYGVEIVSQAIEDAKENAKLNAITNVDFEVGAAEEVADSLPKPDVIVVDPPRKGCDEKLLQTILKHAPQKVVYVSCDSATLARDLKILCESVYELKKVKAVDQFSHTSHVETVAQLHRTNS